MRIMCLGTYISYLVLNTVVGLEQFSFGSFSNEWNIDVRKFKTNLRPCVKTNPLISLFPSQLQLLESQRNRSGGCPTASPQTFPDRTIPNFLLSVQYESNPISPDPCLLPRLAAVDCSSDVISVSFTLVPDTKLTLPGGRRIFRKTSLATDLDLNLLSFLQEL